MVCETGLFPNRQGARRLAIERTHEISRENSPSTREASRYSPRSVLKAVVLSDARHCPISPVGPKPGSRAARELEAHSACWRQLAAGKRIIAGAAARPAEWLDSRSRRRQAPKPSAACQARSKPVRHRPPLRRKRRAAPPRRQPRHWRLAPPQGVPPRRPGAA